MKRALLIIGLILVFFAGCRKDDVLEASKVELNGLDIKVGWDYMKISGEYSYPSALETMKLYLSEKEDMSAAKVYECTFDEEIFSVDVKDLKDGVTYYYCYEYDNGYTQVKSEKESFKTVGKPIVVTKDVGGITNNSAVLSGSVTNNDAANKMRERGFCWGKSKNPTISGSHNNNGGSSGTGTTGFSYNLTNLTSGTKYYVRTYIVTDFGTLYGEEKSFVTTGEEPEMPEEPIVLPTVTTNSVTNITSNSATCGGNVTSDGNGTVSARGICWSETSEPKINNLYSEESNNGTGTGSFTSSMTNLKANTTYYVRVYATNEAGTVYGEVKSFKTLEEEPEETISGTENGHNYVDLGLPSGLKWATCNVGATSPEKYGDYFAWGETTTKTEYTESNCTSYDIAINNVSGNMQYDVARNKWSGPWRIPTETEMEELKDECTWEWVIKNGVRGYKVIGPNGNSIFIPAAGYYDGSLLDYVGTYGEYWCSIVYEYSQIGEDAYVLGFDGGGKNIGMRYRHYGQSVRPVFGGNFEGPEEQPEEPETPSANQSFTVNGVSFTMIAVEGSTFKMGAQNTFLGEDNYDSEAWDNESPVHSVTLSSYYIGETEVTQELWEAVMGSNPSNLSGSQKPVENVSWDDCQEFITKLNELTGENFRLPTEAEWEYAARGGNKSNGYKYSGSNTIGNVSWYTDNSSSTTHDVKTKQANELGIYDMSGNVWEWCQDRNGSYSSGSQTNPTGPSSGSFRVLRGGSWSDHSGGCRVSDRNFNSPGIRLNSFGFRLILQ